MKKNKLYILTEKGLRVLVNPPDWDLLTNSTTQLKNPEIPEDLKTTPLHMLSIKSGKIVKASSIEIQNREEKAFHLAPIDKPVLTKKHVSNQVKVALVILISMVVAVSYYIRNEVKVKVEYQGTKIELNQDK